MNSADDKVVKEIKEVSPSSSTLGKEQEPVALSQEAVQHISTEIEIPEEVKRAGVTRLSETIELPPDVRKLGVTSANVPLTSPTASSTTIPKIVLPITDAEVVSGLHAKITSALRWLAQWCIKRLKKAHLALKSVHGKIIRVKN